MTNATVQLDVRLELDIDDFDTNPDAVAQMLASRLQQAIAEGLLSGGTLAVVDEHEVDTVANPHLFEDAVTRHLEDVLASGALRPDVIARRMAQYGLMSTSEFLEDIEDRAGPLRRGREG